MMIIEQRSIRRGDMVGSCVDIMTRAPWWRCSRITVRSLSVRALEAGVFVIYYVRMSSYLRDSVHPMQGTLWASSTAISFPTVGFDSKYIPMQILNKVQAVFASTKGQDKSTIVILPASKL